MRVLDDKIIDAGDMSAATITSDEVDTQHLSLLGFQAVIPSTTAAGTLKIQASIDGVTWTDVASATASVSLSAAAGSYIISVVDFCYPRVRAVYTKTSGTGSLTVYIFTKGF